MSFDIWNVNDDRDCRSVIRETVEHHFNHVTVRDFEDVIEAAKAVGKCDVALIDMTTAAPLACGPEGCYSQIARFCQLHPGANVILLSGVSSNFAEDVIDRIRGVVDPEDMGSIEYVNLADPMARIEALRRMGAR